MNFFKNVILVVFILFSFITKSQVDYMKNIPLIDREIFFDAPEISGAQLSPDGNFVSFIKKYNNIPNIWIKKVNEPFAKARPLTNNERPISGYFWTYDEKYILFVKDSKGDENYNIYAVDPNASADKTTGVPSSINLTPKKNVRVYIYEVSENNPDILWVGINDRDKAWHDLYKLTISTKKLEKLFENKNRIVGWEFDWDEDIRLAYRSDESGFSQILAVGENNTFKKIYETNLDEDAHISGWTKDNSRAYLVSNKGKVNFSTLYLMDPKTGETTKLESDPKNKVDFGGLFFDKQTREIIATKYIYDKTEFQWKNKKWEANYKFLEEKFPNKEVSLNSSTKDYKKMLISTHGDKYVTEMYYFDTDTRELIFQYTPRPKLKKLEQYLASMDPISYKSSDGMQITGYLTIPKGAIKKDLPLVVIPHGGPKGPRDYWGYDSSAQMLANRGYAVLMPNFRASGGFGKAFLNAGDGEWGRLMQDDITYGVKYLVNKGFVDKNRVAIMGGSYGGYATLAGMTFTPDTYVCGVDIVGPSNLFTLLESIPPYWEAARKHLYKMTGDPNTKAGKKLLQERSPLFFVNNIKKPLMIIQGANDPRVKQAESDQIVMSMHNNNKDVEYILADDEGHGFRKPVNRMAMWAAVEKFLAKYLNGRYQKTMSDGVKKRLQEMTQDTSKVVYKKTDK